MSNGRLHVFELVTERPPFWFPDV